jgi:hypothetical protein
MALNNEYPILDGIAPSWADIVVKASGNIPMLEMKDIAALNTGATLEAGEQRGASGGRLLRHTTGSASYEASMTLYYSGYVKLIRALSGAAPVRGNQYAVSLVHFNIQVQYTPFGDTETYEFHVRGVRYAGRTLNAAEGNDAQQVEVPLLCKEIVDIVDGKEIILL